MKQYNFEYLVHNYFPIPKHSFVLNIASLDDEIRKMSINHIKKAINQSDFLELIENYEYGLTLSEEEIEDARTLIKKCKKEIALVFSSYALILTPASPGKAPKGLGSTGDSVFSRIWTAMGLPCISLPFPQEDNELPLGVQLAGAFGADRKLLAYALWFEELLMR